MIKERHFGLDIVRAFAISIVLLQHSNVISQFIPYNLPNFITELKIPDGVDLFFVLSGFLIGRILLKTDLGNLSSIIKFWKRRLLRTLPNYFLFFIINLILLLLKISPGLLSHAVLYYFVFLQNFHKPVDVFFWESWSLCIEEWFYFLFPLSLLLLNKLNSKKNSIYITCIILFFIFSVGTKFQYINTHQIIDLDLYLRKLAITRFDILCFGLFLALLELTNSILLKKAKWVGLIVFFSYLFYGSKPLGNNLYILHFIYSALACSGLLIFCYNYKNGNKYLTNCIEFISKISYSMYLVHLPVLYILNYFVSKDYSSMPITYFFSYIFVVVSLSYLNYKYFEMYFLKLRNS